MAGLHTSAIGWGTTGFVLCLGPVLVFYVAPTSLRPLSLTSRGVFWYSPPPSSLCSIHETLPDALPVSRIREDDTIVVYERRPLVVAPQEEDRLEDEPADSNTAGDFRVRTDADGTTVVRVTASCRCSLWCHATSPCPHCAG